MDYAGELQDNGKTVCLDHIVDPVLRRHLREAVTENSCSFCGRRPVGLEHSFAVSLYTVAEHILRAISSRYQCFEQASYFEGEAWETDISTGDVVQEVGDTAFDRAVVEAVLVAVTDMIVGPDSWFEDDSHSAFQYSWEGFTETVRHEARFVFLANDRIGAENEPPARLARFLEGVLTYADKSTQMLQTIEPGTALYRGRMTDEVESLYSQAVASPASSLGPAPTSRAAAGRMSGEGVPLFYAADRLHTAVAEIALHSPYDDAVVGEFITQRPLTIVDFTRKPRLPSIFDYAKKHRRMFTEFVDDFVKAITRPILLDGRERVEYVPTQIITEYLRWVPSRQIDGIAFPSRADAKGKNIVLFVGRGDQILSDPPTPEERSENGPERLFGGHTLRPTLMIAASGISTHSVSRSVRVRSRPVH